MTKENACVSVLSLVNLIIKKVILDKTNGVSHLI